MIGGLVMYSIAVIVFIGGELFGLIIFALLKKYLGPPKGSQAIKWAVLKGSLERLTMFIGLLHDFPQILIAFSALKLGTRLHDEKDSQISNTYFLMGNLISIMLTMIYTVVTNKLS